MAQRFVALGRLATRIEYTSPGFLATISFKVHIDTLLTLAGSLLIRTPPELVDKIIADVCHVRYLVPSMNFLYFYADA